jgi:hypothetical protein
MEVYVHNSVWVLFSFTAWVWLWESRNPSHPSFSSVPTLFKKVFTWAFMFSRWTYTYETTSEWKVKQRDSECIPCPLILDYYLICYLLFYHRVTLSTIKMIFLNHIFWKTSTAGWFLLNKRHSLVVHYGKQNVRVQTDFTHLIHEVTVV